MDRRERCAVTIVLCAIVQCCRGGWLLEMANDRPDAVELLVFAKRRGFTVCASALVIVLEAALHGFSSWLF
jgi:hypothetical protein